MFLPKAVILSRPHCRKVLGVGVYIAAAIAGNILLVAVAVAPASSGSTLGSDAPSYYATALNFTGGAAGQFSQECYYDNDDTGF
jgi:hypothetical protein